jgi:hypothetical protein
VTTELLASRCPTNGRKVHFPPGRARGIGSPEAGAKIADRRARHGVRGDPLSLPRVAGRPVCPFRCGRRAPRSSLLIGDFGDGRINIFAKEGRGFAGHATGQILDAATGRPFAEPGLWQVLPGTAAAGGTNALWFTAGINNEADGLLGVLRP